jgi:two-component system, chemotaxis family, CheB/CheR fusion protein
MIEIRPAWGQDKLDNFSVPGSRLHRATTIPPPAGLLPVPTRGLPLGSGGFSVVGLGASAGGLDACRKLVGALPAGNGMAFILVQHLDPTHESMMVDLLAAHTPMVVR